MQIAMPLFALATSEDTGGGGLAVPTPEGAGTEASFLSFMAMDAAVLPADGKGPSAGLSGVSSLPNVMSPDLSTHATVGVDVGLIEADVPFPNAVADLSVTPAYGSEIKAEIPILESSAAPELAPLLPGVEPVAVQSVPPAVFPEPDPMHAEGSPEVAAQMVQDRAVPEVPATPGTLSSEQPVLPGATKPSPAKMPTLAQGRTTDGVEAPTSAETPRPTEVIRDVASAEMVDKPAQLAPLPSAPAQVSNPSDQPRPSVAATPATGLLLPLNAPQNPFAQGAPIPALDPDASAQDIAAGRAPWTPVQSRAEAQVVASPVPAPDLPREPVAMHASSIVSSVVGSIAPDGDQPTSAIAMGRTVSPTISGILPAAMQPGDPLQPSPSAPPSTPGPAADAPERPVMAAPLVPQPSTQVASPAPAVSQDKPSPLPPAPSQAITSGDPLSAPQATLLSTPPLTQVAASVPATAPVMSAMVPRAAGGSWQAETRHGDETVIHRAEPTRAAMELSTTPPPAPPQPVAAPMTFATPPAFDPGEARFADASEAELAPLELKGAELPSARAEALAPRTDLPRHLAQQVADVARMMPDRPVELTLSPEELGRLRLTFTVDGGSMAVAVNAERPETLDLLRRHIDALAQELREIGYDDVTFDFAQGGQARDDGGNGTESATFADPDGGSPMATESQPTPARLALSPGGGIDIRL